MGKIEHSSNSETPGQWQPWAVDAVRDKIVELGTDQESVLEHGVTWSPTSWHIDGLQADCGRIKFAESISDPSDEEGNLVIRRRHVIDAMRKSTRCGFFAAMIWGYGTAGYGPWRVARIVTKNPRLGDNLEAIATTAKRGDARETWKSFKQDRKIKWLGPAFATKFAYFAGRADGASPYPLIADINTSWAMWHLAGVESSAYTARGYAKYVDLVETVEGASPDQVEHACSKSVRIFVAAPTVTMPRSIAVAGGDRRTRRERPRSRAAGRQPGGDRRCAGDDRGVVVIG